MGLFQSVIVTDDHGNCDLKSTYDLLLRSTHHSVSEFIQPVITPSKEDLENHIDIVATGYYEDCCQYCLVNRAVYSNYPCQCKTICALCLRTLIGSEKHERLLTCVLCKQFPVKEIK